MGKSLYEGKRPKGYLAVELNDICQQLITGEVQLEEGVFWTPTNLAQLFVEYLEIEPSDKPSTGALNNILKRWESIGYIVTRKNPFAFVDFTDDGRTYGLAELERRAKALKDAHTADEIANKLEAEAAEAKQRAEAAALALASEKG